MHLLLGPFQLDILGITAVHDFEDTTKRNLGTHNAHIFRDNI